MPGFTAHHIFGFQTIKEWEKNSLKNILKYHPSSFSLGLQGPDLFFYYPPSYVLPKKNLGSLTHIKNTGTFLSYLLQSRKLFRTGTEYEIALAYITGFLGHYILDTRCHPYVYFRTHYEKRENRYYGHHMNLEADLDAELLQYFYHQLPSHFHQHEKIAVSSLERRTIAKILQYTCQKTYHDLHCRLLTMKLSIHSIEIGTCLLADPNGTKKRVLRKLEHYVPGYPILSPMIRNDHIRFYEDPFNLKHRQWHNPWDPSLVSYDSFLDLFQQAEYEYLDVLRELEVLFSLPEYTVAEKKAAHTLLKRMGNLSYHSGLDAGIPS